MEIPELVEETIGSTNVTVTVLKVTQTQMDRTTTSKIEFFFTQPPYAAEYICRASNLLGTIERAANLTVQGMCLYIHTVTTIQIYACILLPM